MRYALVTGGSSGIGLQYANALARDYRYNILLVSNQEKELPIVAADLTKQFGVEAKWLYMNLAEQDAADKVYAYCKEQDIEVEVLINNAGMLVFKPFWKSDPRRLETLLMLHVVTMTKLTRLFAADFVNRPTTKRLYPEYVVDERVDGDAEYSVLQCEQVVCAELHQSAVVRDEGA